MHLKKKNLNTYTVFFSLKKRLQWICIWIRDLQNLAFWALAWFLAKAKAAASSYDACPRNNTRIVNVLVNLCWRTTGSSTFFFSYYLFQAVYSIKPSSVPLRVTRIFHRKRWACRLAQPLWKSVWKVLGNWKLIHQMTQLFQYLKHIKIKWNVHMRKRPATLYIQQNNLQ